MANVKAKKKQKWKFFYVKFFQRKRIVSKKNPFFRVRAKVVIA